MISSALLSPPIMPAIWPHMNVFENIAFGLRVRPREFRPTDMEITRRVLRLLKLVQPGQMAVSDDEIRVGLAQAVIQAR